MNESVSFHVYRWRFECPPSPQNRPMARSSVFLHFHFAPIIVGLSSTAQCPFSSAFEFARFPRWPRCDPYMILVWIYRYKYTYGQVCMYGYLWLYFSNALSRIRRLMLRDCHVRCHEMFPVGFWWILNSFYQDDNAAQVGKCLNEWKMIFPLPCAWFNLGNHLLQQAVYGGLILATTSCPAIIILKWQMRFFVGIAICKPLI
jgi:hypothetical protein